MFLTSNNLIGLLNFLTFLLSIPILARGIWLSARSTTDCDKFLDRPIIAVGVFLMVVSLTGLAGACCRVSCLLWLYLLVMFLLIVLLFCFTIFAFVVTHKGVGEIVSRRGYKEYRLGDYSNWLQKRVNDSEKGSKIKSCLAGSNVCKKLGASNDAETKFYQRNLSPIQANEDLSDEEEKDMLDYLYTAQYLMGGIVGISLGLSLYRLMSLLMVKLWIRTEDNEVTSNMLPLQEGWS